MNETCGCCEGIERLTPIAIINRPGLDALIYRVGTHASFLETMIARLSNLGIPQGDLDMPLDDPADKDKLIYPLQGLTTRSASDPSLAFLDAWATVADVLTFYQERIANEGYLRTATERRSVLELARLVGYVLRPGVAASVFLAYTLEKVHDVTILPSNRAQSVPDPGQLPQSFETAEPLEARFVWNTLQPRLTRPQVISLTSDSGAFGSPPASPPSPPGINTDTIYLQGTATHLKQGDPLLFIFGDSDPEAMFAFVKVTTVEVQTAENRTRVELDSDQSQPKSTLRSTAMMAMFPMSSPAGSPASTTTGELSFANIVGQLKTPPSLSPPNSQQLKRNVADIFSRQSDIQQQLLVNLVPALQSTLYSALGNAQVTLPPSQPLKSIQALRVKAAPFGHNMPLPPPASPPDSGGQILSLRMFAEPDDSTRFLALDAEYKGITKKSWVVVERRDTGTKLFRVDDVLTVTLGGHQVAEELSFFSTEPPTTTTMPTSSTGTTALTGTTTTSDPIKVRVTLLKLDAPWRDATDDPTLVLPNTTVYAQSELLTPAEEPVDDPVGPNPDTSKQNPNDPNDPAAGDVIELATLEAGLKPGRRMIITGERANVFQSDGMTPIRGIMVSELIMVASVTQSVQKLPDSTDLSGDKIHTFLHLAKKLAYAYRRETVTIYGNVVRATHGETRSETLGSGDRSKALQRFSLRQSPLTYLAAPIAAGAQSTLQVRVNDILWHEIDSLVEASPTDRSYTTETDDSDKTTAIFGNGQYGARLPTGVENVKAVYRTGIGKPGNVKAGQITLLATKPLGVKSVTNPLRASGGADRESRDSARRNVPLALLALDRLVSVEDYEDFARIYAGIGKASAQRLSDGRRQLVHLTIAGADNIPIDKNSDLYLNLVQALFQLGDPNLPLRVDLCEVMFIVISARVHLLPDYQWESVESKIRTTLLDTFSFERRNLGQPVFESEVLSVIQGMAGVDYVDLQVLAAVDEDKIVSALDTIKQNPSNPDLGDINEAGEQDESETAEFLELLGLNTHGNIPVNLATIDSSATDPDKRIIPAQLAFLSPDVPDTLILTELP